MRASLELVVRPSCSIVTMQPRTGAGKGEPAENLGTVLHEGEHRRLWEYLEVQPEDPGLEDVRCGEHKQTATKQMSSSARHLME